MRLDSSRSMPRPSQSLWACHPTSRSCLASTREPGWASVSSTLFGQTGAGRIPRHIIDPRAYRASLITRQSSVQVPIAQLELTVAKFNYRRVIRKAGVHRRRPFRVLGPVVATVCVRQARLKVSLSTMSRDSTAAPRRLPAAPISPKTLGCLVVYHRLG